MKVYLSKIKESWVVDKFREEFINFYPQIITNRLSKADIVWILAPWVESKFPFEKIKNQKILCSFYHLDNEFKNDEDKKLLLKLDSKVDYFHTISIKSKNDIAGLTNKKIFEIPFWVNKNKYFYIDDKTSIREKYNFKSSDYLIGSFQRDSEGDDVSKPKLIKGPDIFFEIVNKLNNENDNLKVVLAGNRREYLISKLEQEKIKFKYYKMINDKQINELYNILDLYIVSSRKEGGPQAILECATTETPIISSEVGVAAQILDNASLFNYKDLNTFFDAKPNTDIAKINVKKYETPQGVNSFYYMLKEIYES